MRWRWLSRFIDIERSEAGRRWVFSLFTAHLDEPGFVPIQVVEANDVVDLLIRQFPLQPNEGVVR